jgi:hypothetical protein
MPFLYIVKNQRFFSFRNLCRIIITFTNTFNKNYKDEKN